MSRTQPLRRRDAFFGLHFDLHPGKNDTELGADLTEEMVARLLEEVRPDYVQYDCKGHPGYAGYPTKVGWPSPGIVKDSLAVWRKVTREHGIGLYVHYSGIWDSLAVEKHPEWARVDPEGRPDKNATSPFGPYCEELLIPQLKEAIDSYDLDGVWVDGECWAVQPDYRPGPLASFKKETGIEEAPTKPEDQHWPEFLEFQRQAFRRYLAKYVDALHKHKPSFQITSNWMYSTLAPEPITVGLDFISGDYSPNDSVNTARLEARYMASTGMPWDLMAWGFNKGKDCGHSVKTPLQLKQEAAIVLSQGGGFQIYYNPTRAGWIDGWMVRTMADVARFCRARQAFSHRTETVPQVALLLSRTSLYNSVERIYYWGDALAPLHGMLHALLELHYSVDVFAEHQPGDKLTEYSLIVVPEWHMLPEDFTGALLGYVQSGGSLLLVGAGPVRIFRDHLGVELLGDPGDRQMFIQGGDSLAWVGGPWQEVEPGSAEVVGRAYASSDTRKEPICAASANHIGQGIMAGIYGPFGSVYGRCHSSVMRRFLGDMTARLLHTSLEVAAPPCVDLSLRRKGADLLVHLANTANMQTAPSFTNIDFVPPVGPIALEMSASRRPREVLLEPGHMPVTWDWVEGDLRILVKSLPIHLVLAIRDFFAEGD